MSKLNIRSSLRLQLCLLALAICLSALFPLLLPVSGAQATPFLRPVDEEDDSPSQRDPTILRSQSVRVDLRQLRNKEQRSLLVPLFDGRALPIIRERVEDERERGFVWHGKIANEPDSVAILSVVGEVVIGNITTQRGEVFHLRYLGHGMHSLRLIDQSKYPPEELPTDPQIKPRQGDDADTCATDPPSDIDVMVVYTAAARAAAGGVDAMEATIYLSVAETNLSYFNSQITQRLRLVHLREVSYAESGNVTTDRDRLKNPSDGFLDSVHTLRNTYAADAVIMIVENISACGQAFIMTTVSNAFESSAFGVVRRDCSTGNYSFGHELAHLMSARHDWVADSTNNSPYAFNHGFFNPTKTWRTVMAYGSSCAGCPRLPYFSNPNVDYPSGSGDWMGASSGPQQADNRQTLNNTALTVANFRCSSPAISNVWMKDTWNDTGAEPDPLTASEAMWLSPYIWIRNTQDANLLNQHQHQNPEFGSTNWVYVKLHNGGSTTASGNLELYWANASTGLSWPADWNLLGTIPVSGFAAHSTRVVEQQWTNLPGTGHYCMLARWVSAADPMTHPETSDINANVRKNNNLVWRNLNIIDLVKDELDIALMIVRNSGKERAAHSLVIRAPRSEAQHSFLREGQVIAQLDESLTRAWRQGGARGQGFKAVEGGFLISGDGAVFDNLILDRQQVGRVRLTFRKLPTTPKRQYLVDTIQYELTRIGLSSASSGPRLVGGVSYEIHTDERPQQ